MDRSFEIGPVPDAQVRSGPVRSSVRDRSGSRDRQNIGKNRTNESGSYSGRYFFERQLANFDFFFETSNGRLPLEQSSDRRETLAKRVSDDLQLFIFRRRKKKIG